MPGLLHHPESESNLVISDTIKKARELLATHDWVQGVYATDKYGTQVPYTDIKACNFCISGAIRWITDFPNALQAEHFIESQMRTLTNSPKNNKCLTIWNDETGRTKTEVLDLLTKAEQLALAEGI